jgi:synaptobrevin family protein YKT6
LESYLTKYQNPKEADAMTRIQTDIDETKIILHDAITGILQRGEKLDTLVAKSEDLSTQSKVFYKTARKTNQCCHLL